jgi:membrane peptidoglycan carboxypeptidase
MLPKAKDRPKGLRIGMASIDPTTGAVRAIYGGPKYLGAENNQATIDRAQGGSTFKAFGLIAALEDGVSLKTQYNSDSPVKIGKATVRNSSDGEASGYKDLVFGTAHSLNTVYAQLNADVGPDKTTKAAREAGIPKSIEIDDNAVNVLGSADPHAIDMASAYATFAAGGIHHKPYTIQKIIRAGTKDVVLDREKPRGERVFKAGAVADLNYALQQVVKVGTGSYANRLDFPVAGKTGTSTDARSALFVGYTPKLSTSVMMYQIGTAKVNGKKVPSNVKMKGFGQFKSIFGGGYPTMIWTDFMERAMKGKSVEEFPPRANVGEITNAPPPTVAPTEDPDPTETPDPNPTTTETPDPSQTNPLPSQTNPDAPDPNQPGVTISPTIDDGGGGGDGGGGDGQ